jgi:hypothetical protein
MAADKSIPEDTDIQETLAERVVKLQLNISENKKEFIRNQAQIGLLGFLVDARQKLDAAEVRMMAQLGNQGRSVFSFFSNSKKVFPAGAVDELTAEFETARRLLWEVNDNILSNADDTNLEQLASHQHNRFEADVKKLKDGKRIERYWNNTTDKELYSYEIEERQALGKIGINKSKIFSILDEVDDELSIFSLRVKDFLKITKERVDAVIEKQVDIAFKEFAASPLGIYIVDWMELQSKTARLQAKGAPQSIIDKTLNNITLRMQDTKDDLAEVDLEKVNNIENFEFSKLEILTIALPDEKYEELILKINKGIHMKEKSVEIQNIASHYRRSP